MLFKEMMLLKNSIKLNCSDSYYWNMKNNKTFFKVPCILCGNLYTNNKSLAKFNSTFRFNLMSYDISKFNSTMLCVYINASTFDKLIPIKLSITIPSDSDTNTTYFEIKDIPEDYLELDISELIHNINYKTNCLTLILSIVPNDTNAMLQIESEISYHPPYIKSSLEAVQPKTDPTIPLLNKVIDKITVLSNTINTLEQTTLSNTEKISYIEDLNNVLDNLSEDINKLNNNNLQLLNKLKTLSIQSINIQ